MPKFFGTARAVYQTRSTTYTADANGVINVPAANSWDIADLLNMGLIMLGQTGAISNVSATTDPTATSDSAAGYGVGSIWSNVATGVEWRCLVATANAAVWVPHVSTGVLLGRLIGANMNVTTDQPIVMTNWAVLNKYRPTKITVKNASTSLTTAAGGVYNAVSKGGTAVVAAAQAYSGLTGSTLALDLTIASTPGLTLQNANVALYLSLTTAQGGAATADLYVWGDVYP